jgi:flagellar biosynthesis protein FlhF
MIEIPLLTAGGREELADRLRMLADKRLVLIDTAGMSQRDLRLSEQFHDLQAGAPEIDPYLVLSANTQLPALNEIIRNFGKVRLAGAIVTKIDECASLGGIITAAIRYKLPLSYCGTGQRVPEDLQQARAHRLVSKAVSLMQKYSEQVDKDTLAFRYNNIISRQPH